MWDQGGLLSNAMRDKLYLYLLLVFCIVVYPKQKDFYFTFHSAKLANNFLDSSFRVGMRYVGGPTFTLC